MTFGCIHVKTTHPCILIPSDMDQNFKINYEQKRIRKKFLSREYLTKLGSFKKSNWLSKESGEKETIYIAVSLSCHMQTRWRFQPSTKDI